LIDQADKRIREWIEEQVGATAITFDPPGSSQDSEGISCYLLDITSAKQYRGTRRPPLVITLRYLVTTWSSNSVEAHRLLGTLVFAAMQEQDYQIDLAPVSPDIWLGFGTIPQPSFILSIPLTLELPEPEIPLVREPMIVNVAPFLNLTGQVLGPGGVPITGAVVEAPGTGRQATTDTKGRFSLSQLPGGSRDQKLIVHAKGKQNTITVKEPAKGEPIIIHFEGLK
jgi:hypothetical protein